MPFPLTLEISNPAKDDLRDIAQYTFSTYGAAQMDSYLQTLYDTMELLTENPRIAQQRDDLPEGYVAFYAGRHTLIFTVSETTVTVVRVIHQSRDRIILLPKPL